MPKPSLTDPWLIWLRRYVVVLAILASAWLFVAIATEITRYVGGVLR